jgi:hypothetical protein
MRISDLEFGIEDLQIPNPKSQIQPAGIQASLAPRQRADEGGAENTKNSFATVSIWVLTS